MSKIETKELLKIVKESFEEEKGIKILSLYFQEDDNTIYGIYILPLEQSLSFNEEPLLDMVTEIDGHNIIMQELGQILLYIYNFGSIHHYSVLTYDGPNYFDVYDPIYDDLLCLCEENIPLQRFAARFIEWIELTDEVLEQRTQTFFKLCQQYDIYDSLDYDIDIQYQDDVDIQQQFKDVCSQLKNKKYLKISEYVIYKINKLYVQLQVDLYMTDNK